VELVSTGALAKALGVSRAAVNRWVGTGLLVPDVTTPGGHHRWDVDRVREQLGGRDGVLGEAPGSRYAVLCAVAHHALSAPAVAPPRDPQE
jgi:hypothetical protein